MNMSDKDVSVIVLPAEAVRTFQPFVPVSAASTDEETTVADVAMLHNAMVIVDAAIQQAHTIDGVCKLAVTMAKLIETRRNVKKLPYGHRAAAVKDEYTPL